MSKEILKVENVGMRFNLMEKKVDNFKEYVIKFIKNELRYQEFWALKYVSFTVNKGDRLGILGLNGAGKSTLLKIIAGVLKASEGNLTVKGKIVPLLELGEALIVNIPEWKIFIYTVQYWDIPRS